MNPVRCERARQGRDRQTWHGLGSSGGILKVLDFPIPIPIGIIVLTPTLRETIHRLLAALEGLPQVLQKSAVSVASRDRAGNDVSHQTTTLRSFLSLHSSHTQIPEK